MPESRSSRRGNSPYPHADLRTFGSLEPVVHRVKYTSEADDELHSWREAQLAKANDPAECRPYEVEFTLAWARHSFGHLRGDLVAVNVSDRAWRISYEPEIVPTRTDGLPLWRSPLAHGRPEPVMPHVVLQPGQRARARVIWVGWDGQPVGHAVVLSWPGGTKLAPTSGPRHPEAFWRSGRMVISASTFDRDV